MPYNGLSISKIAKIVGCHPNTFRAYEAWGLLPTIPRAANGNRYIPWPTSIRCVWHALP